MLLAIYAPATSREHKSAGRFFADITTIVRHPGCLVLAFAFFAYSCQIFSLAFALPLLLTSAHGVSLGGAGLLSALVLAVSAIGHVSSGYLLRAGVPVWINIAAAFACFALSGFAIYGGALSPQGISLVAALALGIGGLAPGAIYAAAPHAAPGPLAVPPTIGLVQQASNLGQFAGPVVLGVCVEHFGWHAAPVILAPAALVGLASAFVLRRILVIDQ
jgi:predicted MFS family arabinose efflux permease